MMSCLRQVEVRLGQDGFRASATADFPRTTPLAASSLGKLLRAVAKRTSATAKNTLGFDEDNRLPFVSFSDRKFLSNFKRVRPRVPWPIEVRPWFSCVYCRILRGALGFLPVPRLHGVV